MKKRDGAKSLGKRVGAFFRSIFGRVSLSYEAPQWANRKRKNPGDKAAENPGSTDAVGPKSKVPQWLSRAFKAIGRIFNLAADTLQVRIIKIVAFSVVGLAAIIAIIVVFALPGHWVNYHAIDPEPTALEFEATINPLIVEFSESAARIDLSGKTISEGITISPAIKGKWLWLSDDKLEFQPQEEWACDQSYSVEMGSTIFSPNIRIFSRSFSFKTAAFDASIASLYFAIDPRDEQDRRVMGTVACNYPVDIQTLKGKLELKLVSQAKLGQLSAVPIELSYDSFLGKIFIKSDRLPLPNETAELELRVAGNIQTKTGAKWLGKDLNRRVKVPGIYDRVTYLDPELTVVRNENYEYQEILNIPLSGDANPEKIQSALSVWLLPADRQNIPGYEDAEKYTWTEKEVDRNVLAQAQKLELNRLPTEHDQASLVSFAYRAPAGRQIFVELNGMVPAFGGYVIKEGRRAVAQVPEIPKSLSIMHDGAILSLGGSKTLSVVSNDVDTVRFQAKRLFPDQVNHLITQTDGDFANMSFSNPSQFSADDMSTVYEEVRDLKHLDPGLVQYYSFDFSRYLDRGLDPQERHGLFMFRVAEWDKTNKNEGETRAERFILITDLGILAKRSPDASYDIFVQNIRSGSPSVGARVEVLGRNGVALFSVLTNEKGHASIPSLKGFLREKMPVVFTAANGGDFSFLPIIKGDRMLDFSRFDVGGIRGASDPDKLSAFVFSDRGLYRPGDNINIGYIVKAGDWQRNLAELPLEITLNDPRGVEIWKKLVKLPGTGFDEIAYRTLDGATTGHYEFTISLVKDDNERQWLGSIEVRVEEFVPDRLSISSHIKADAKQAWVPFDSLQATVHLMNLYGLPASENPIRSSFRLIPRQLDFDKFPDYTFHDAWASDKYYEEKLPDTQTDKDGNANLAIDLSKFEPGTFQLVLETEGLEKQGGRSVLSNASVIVSPLKSIVGWKSDGRLDYINKDAQRTVQLIAIDASQKPVALDNLRQVVEEIRYVSVLVKQEDDSYRYQSVQKKIPVSQKVMAIPAGGLSLTLDSATPGDFEMSLIDKDGRVRSRINWSIIGKGNLTRNLDRNAELQIKLNRSSFETGDEIELQIKAPYAGSGLITIERDQVYASQWFSTDSNASIQRIRIPEGVEGNAYVNVAFLRGLDSREIYMSPLSYGVQNFEVSISKRKVNITLDTPAEAKPGKPFIIKYRSDKPAKIVVYAVDEGILQLAKYQTPKPLSYFFQKRALEVQTSQILDLILPEFALVQEMAAMGGDAGALGKRQNPFKRKHQEPIAYWSGIIDSDQKTRELSYTVPAYFNGTLRVMAVAVAAEAIGSQERKALIRNDFIITPTVPLFVAPGDEFQVGVTLANNAKLDQANPTVTLSLAADAGVTIQGPASQTLKLAYQSEGTLWFKLKAGPTPGAPKLKFTASAAGVSSEMGETLSVRPAIAWRQSIATGVLKSGSKTVETPRQLFPEFRTLKVSASFKPMGLSLGLLSYLDNYPYGCSEQLISKSFPLVLLADQADSGVTKARAEESFRNTVKVLRARQNSDGSIGLWAAAGPDWFVSVYAAQFLTEAQGLGFSGGESLRKQLLEALQGFVDQSAREQTNLELASYACWVLTLNGRVTTSALTDIRSGLDKKLADWQRRSAGLYLAGCYALLKQQAEADKLLAAYGNGTERAHDYFDVYYDSNLSEYALQVIMNSRYRSRNGFVASSDVLDKIVAILSNNGFSTVSSAQTLLAFRSYTERAPNIGPNLLQLSQTGADGKKRDFALKDQPVFESGYDAESKAIEFNNKAGLPLYWQVVQSGFDLNLPSQPVNQGLEVFREFQDDQGKPVTVAKRGQELTAVVRIRSTGNRPVRNVAISDLLPGGFELVLDQQANRSFDEMVKGSLERIYGEAREDRVIMIGNVDTKLTEYRYKLKAVNVGSFALPGPFAEAMYDQNLRAQAAAGRITVTE